MRFEVPGRLLQNPGAPEEPRPLLINIVMESNTSTSAAMTNYSTVSSNKYTYWLLNGDRTTDRAAANETTTSGTAGGPQRRHPPTLQTSYDDEDEPGRVYVVETNDEDDVELRLMGPPLPVSSLSGAVAGNRFCFCGRVVDNTAMIAIAYLTSYYVVYAP